MAENQLGPVGLSNKTLLITGGVALLLVGGLAWYAKYKIGQGLDAAGDAAKTVGNYIATDAVNVTSDKNVANVIVNKTLQATGVLGTNNMTGKVNTIGSAVYEGEQWVRSLF